MLSLAFSAIIAPAAYSDVQFDEYLETRISLAQDIQQHFWPQLNQQLGPDGFSIVHEFYGAHSAWGSSLWKFTREGDAWRLLSHETIPFAPGSQAGAVLKCDKRGCIALVRRQQGNMRD